MTAKCFIRSYEVELVGIFLYNLYGRNIPLVISLSSEEVPDIAYMYLAKGLNFVENKTDAKEDLLFDAKEFL